jgi:hypothetical protein
MWEAQSSIRTTMRIIGMSATPAAATTPQMITGGMTATVAVVLHTGKKNKPLN